MLGNRVAVSPIVTVEPRRRKFHKPITLTIPVPKASQKGMLNQYGGQETPTLRLLCSITGETHQIMSSFSVWNPRSFPFSLLFVERKTRFFSHLRVFFVYERRPGSFDGLSSPYLPRQHILHIFS
jgi:hypothetical protein